MKLIPSSLLALLVLVPTWMVLAEAPSKGIPSSWDRDGFVNSKDGSVLVTVPAGEFFMGAVPTDSWAEADEKPGRRITLPAFQISKYEVTNAQYDRFVQATGHREAGDADRIKYGEARWGNAGRVKYAAQWGPRAPVVGVAWNDAQAYCVWAGLRLPSEQEWERAARGSDDARCFPWGDDFGRNERRAVFNAKRPAPVGSLALGVSPAGCFDMTGNVNEWTSTKYNDKQYVVRGGSWEVSYPAYLRVSFRGASDPGSSSKDSGFRCVRTP